MDKNEVFYIGIGKKRLKRNFLNYSHEYERAYSKGRRSKFWKYIISKTKYNIEILFECDDIQLIKNKEKEFIKLYGRRDLGLGTLVNMTDGGDGGFGVIQSEETKNKRANKLRGRSYSDEDRKRMVEGRIGMKFSESHRQNMGCVRKGKKFNQDHKDKIIPFLLQNSNKKVYQFSLEGIFIKEYNSSLEASKRINYQSHTHINACARGERKKAGGYRWSYDINLN